MEAGEFTLKYPTPGETSSQPDFVCARLALLSEPPKKRLEHWCRTKTLSKIFLTLFDDVWRCLSCTKNIEKCRKMFWNFLTIFDVFWRGPFPRAPFAVRWSWWRKTAQNRKRARFCTQSCSKVGQLLANSSPTSHPKGNCRSLPWGGPLLVAPRGWEFNRGRGTRLRIAAFYRVFVSRLL